MATAPPTIRLDHVGKRFGNGPEVLAGIDLTVQPGACVGVVGPSGCGKSTLLRIIAGLSPCSDGRVVFADSGGQPATPPAMGFIFQDATLLPWLTVAANIATPLRLRGTPRAERAAAARRLAAMVGLEPVLGYYPRQLSGGMRMRVSIARALSLEPSVLLLDEPFGALDAITRNRLNEEFSAIQTRLGSTALFVTHSVNEAVFLCHRVLILDANPGRVAAEIAVPLPFPRDRATREDPVFHRLVAATSAALHRTLGKEDAVA
jgi:NitT/TauT family transport system ATP-binding protein